MVAAAAGRASSPEAGCALEDLCTVYWLPLYAFVRRSGYSEHDAQDLTQEFFARLLEKGWLGAADRKRGKFRTFLLTALKHFLANEWDRSQRLKRGGGHAFLSFDGATAEARYGMEPQDHRTPERAFERRWALALLDSVLTRLREEYATAGKATAFEELKGAITGTAAPYEQIAARLGVTENAVKLGVYRLKQRYRELLRAEVAQTVAAPGEIDAELAHLLAALRT